VGSSPAIGTLESRTWPPKQAGLTKKRERALHVTQRGSGMRRGPLFRGYLSAEARPPAFFLASLSHLPLMGFVSGELRSWLRSAACTLCFRQRALPTTARAPQTMQLPSLTRLSCHRRCLDISRSENSSLILRTSAPPHSTRGTVQSLISFCCVFSPAGFSVRNRKQLSIKNRSRGAVRSRSRNAIDGASQSTVGRKLSQGALPTLPRLRFGDQAISCRGTSNSAGRVEF
jgi:hypothetical protein